MEKDKSLKDKAIDFKGKQYVQVADRILYFNETYPTGSIKTEVLSDLSAEMVIVKATVVPESNNPSRIFVGHSQAKWGDGFVNKTSALENAETSAIGRALAMMGIGVIESITSADEINKANISSEYKPHSEEKPKQNGGVTKVGLPVIWNGIKWQHIVGISTKTGQPYDMYVDINPNKKEQAAPISTEIMESNLRNQEREDEAASIADDFDRAMAKE